MAGFGFRKLGCQAGGSGPCCDAPGCENVSGQDDLSQFDLQCIISGTGTALDGTYILIGTAPPSPWICYMDCSGTKYECYIDKFGGGGWVGIQTVFSNVGSDYIATVNSQYSPNGFQKWVKNYGATKPNPSAFSSESIPFDSEDPDVTCSAVSSTLTLTAI